MLRKRLTILAVVALAVTGSYDHAAGQPDTAWTRWYGGASDEEAYSIQQTEDGGFIVVGYTTTFGGGGKDVWLLKTDSQGDTLWTRMYGGPQDDIGRSVRQTYDGGYIIAGHTYSFGAGNADLWLIKTDADGDSLWAKTYGGTANDVGNSVRQTEDGGYIIAGTSASFSEAYDDVWLLRTDSAGDTVWTEHYNVSDDDDRGAEVEQTHDGGFVVVGHSYYPLTSENVLDFTLYKTDSLGNTIWAEIYGERVEQRGASVDQTSDGGYILTGYTAHSYMTNPDVYVVKTDSAGDTTWTKTYGGSGWEEGYLVRETTKKGYFIAGKTNSFGEGGFDVWVLKLDSNGDTLWAKTYGGTSDDLAYSGQQTADVGYIIVGYTESFGAGGKDIFLIRFACPRVLSTSPAQNELNVPVSTNISITFDVDMDETTINDSTFVVNARSTGLHPGTTTYDGPSKTATFDPIEDFDEGEVVTVVLTTGIQSSDGAPLDSAYVWSFTSAVYDGSGTFAPYSVYAVGSDPRSVFSADLDGDGDLDLATANEGADNVSVLLNNGDGIFTPDSVYTVGGDPRSVFSADLDGDGDLDLATANTNSNNVSVLLNNGDGTFAPDSAYPAGGYPNSVFSADLDGDGDLDLATANAISNNVSVLLNNGDGTFAAHSLYAVGSEPFSVFSADLDGDGDLDLATANTFMSNNVSVLLNNGDGTFPTHSVYPVGDYPVSVFSADLDGDGDLDLATANQWSDNVSVLLNNGDGTFAPQSLYPVDDGPRSVFSADLDGDGDLDLATANTNSNNVSVLLNNGDGTFAPQSLYPVGDGPYSVFSSDLDGDGDLDLATANYLSHNVSVLLNLPPWDVLVTPGYDTSGSASTDVAVGFHIQNTGYVLDSYDVSAADSLGWGIDPVYYEVTLDTGQVDSVSFTVSIPNVPLGTTNRVFVIAISQADPSIFDTASLTVTCDAYNVDIADISDVGNDQGKQVRIDWTSFPGSDPWVTHFTAFRRIDSLLLASVSAASLTSSTKDYPPGNWEIVGTYPAYGETVYSATVPTLKDSTISEGMYWSVFFVRAGTDDPLIYFDSPVDSGYSLDNLSPSPPGGLLASHEPAATKLTWSAIPEVDFDYFTVYRDTLSGFTPDPSNRLGYTIDSVFFDSTAELGRTLYYLVCATDFSGNQSDPSNEAAGARYMAGDANADGVLDLGDAIYLLNYLFKNDDPPSPLEAGDANCDGKVEIGDAIYLLNYLFKNGPPPGC